MAALVSCPKHNMVACLEKTKRNAQFHEIVDFLTRSSIYYSLTVSPTVSTSLIEQFWNTATSKTVNDVSYIKAKVAGKTVSISEASIRRDLLFNDVDGIDCLTNQEIYENLQLMGSKSTSWDQFPTNIASALICLATDRKFNFSKMIFKGHVTPLFPNMLAQAVVDKGEDNSVFDDLDADLAHEAKGSGEKGVSTVSIARLDVDTARPEVNTASAPVSTASVTISTANPEVSSVEPRTPPTTTSIYDDKDITMAQTLIKMKEEKAKEKGVAFKDV
ncbi:hypothetical protein Tco_1169723, partial [Tanacetum coccineum]